MSWTPPQRLALTTYLVSEIIRELEKQIEAGNLTLAGEKRALNDISSAKRLRKTVEGFKAEQDLIDADRAKAEELRKELVGIFLYY